MSESPTKGLGRFAAPDERDLNFRMAPRIPSGEPERRWRYFIGGPVLDQGYTPQCVGYMWKQWASSSPVMDPGPDPEASEIYRMAQKRDEWPGESYDGTSVRGGAKAMVDLGFIEGYIWTWSADECRRWILFGMGPLCFGTLWYRGMSDPGSSGIVSRSGPIDGGHAYLAIGYSQDRGAFRCINSWGRAWGEAGRFWLLGEDLDALLTEDGEACAAVQNRVMLQSRML